jgi:hypothetical protein
VPTSLPLALPSGPSETSLSKLVLYITEVNTNKQVVVNAGLHSTSGGKILKIGSLHVSEVVKYNTITVTKTNSFYSFVKNMVI